MAENNKLNASSEYQSDVSTELNVSASLSNNESSGSNVRDSVTSINTANPPSSTPDLKNVQDLTRYVELLLQQMQERFQNISDQVLSRIDDMGNRIDDLERNIADLVTQTGVEGPPK